MRKKLVIGATVIAVAGLASAGVAVNAATLSLAPASSIGQAPSLLVPSVTPSVVDDKGGMRPDDVSDDATPSPVPSVEPGDDNLPSNSGQDDGANHDAGDDNLPQHSGQDDAPPAPAPEAGDDNAPQHSGADDTAPAPAPEPNDDNLPQHSGLDDGADHDAGDDNPDQSHSGEDDDEPDDDDGGHSSDDD